MEGVGTNPREELLRVVTAARDQAKTILATLEQQGHPQTSESNGVYFGLVTILKQLRTIDPAPPWPVSPAGWSRWPVRASASWPRSSRQCAKPHASPPHGPKPWGGR